MTESEAIEKLKNMRLFMQIEDKNSDCKFSEDDYKAYEMAIQALKEVQQYHAIGTLEECRAAMEKQMDEKPTAVLGTFGGTEYECKNCGNDVYYGDEYCRWCGRKLDWSDND